MFRPIPLFFLITISINGQTELETKKLYKWFDNTIGSENSGLIDGLMYRDLYKGRNGNHKFFLSSNYQIGNIAYKGQQYYDVEFKYDIHDDELIVKIPTQSITHTLQLIKKEVDSFSIKDAKFVALDNVINYKNGFYQLLFKRETLSLFKKHIKTSHKYYSGSSIFYRFKSKVDYLLYFRYGRRF